MNKSNIFQYMLGTLFFIFFYFSNSVYASEADLSFNSDKNIAQINEPIKLSLKVNAEAKQMITVICPNAFLIDLERMEKENSFSIFNTLKYDEETKEILISPKIKGYFEINILGSFLKTGEMLFLANDENQEIQANYSVKDNIYSQSNSENINSAEAKATMQNAMNVRLVSEVFDENGQEIKKAKKGDILTYRFTLKNPFVGEVEEKKYMKFLIKSMYLDPNLENFSDISVKDADGNNIPGIFTMYDPIQNIIVALYISDSASLNAKQDMYLEYKATIKEDSSSLNEITAQTSCEAELPSGEELPYKESNVVKTIITGELLFISSPKQLNFGDALVISRKDEIYSINTKDDDLVVRDTRGKNNHWRITAKLLKPLESANNHLLVDSLRYKNLGEEYIFRIDNSILIIDKTTENDDFINVSRDWGNKDQGIFLYVQAGKAYAEEYSTAIEWTLENVP
ncbi:hypothetical protein [Enterococcus sp. MSG3310]|uniref:hypothetical protein n=1 Tax=Enterococcus sp. MSG3310 TaxID=2774835 RepID=UPI003D2FF9AF